MGPPSKGFAKELTPALTKRDVSKRAGTRTRNSTKGGDPYAYSRVWSKEAYGGEYHVARSMDGADAMVENAKEVELGYEKPVGGLTTNFVGNHMTQGAIDLVQAELNRPDPYYEARALGAAASQQQQYALPQRVDGDGAGAGAPLPEAVIAPEAFTWVDMCSRVVVIVPEPRAAGAGFELLCADFSMRACKVEWRTAGNKLVRFQVRDAYGALDAASCSAAPKAAAAEDGGEVIITLAKLGGGMRSAGGVCGADCADGSEGVIGSASPRGADTSTSRVWKALERPSAIVAVPASRRGGVSKPTVDARALRRSLKAARAARKSTGVRPAADGSDAAVAEAMAEAAKIAAGSTTPLLPCSGGDKTGEAPGADEGEVPKGYSVESAKAEGNKLFSLGDYDGAVRRYTWALRLSDVDQKPLGAVGADDAPGTADACDGTAALRCTLLINRATAMAQLGAFDAVEADCTRALAIVPRSAKALLRRALAREQTERFEDAIADARAVLETLPSERRASELLHRCAKVMDSERRRLERIASRRAELSEEHLKQVRHAVRRIQLSGETEEVISKDEEGSFFNTKPGKRPGAII